MRFKSLQSGSNGNSIYIGSEDTHLLIDAGISCKRITEGLASVSLSPEDLSGILITHEHSDHITGLYILSKKYGIPIYGTAGTLQAIRETDKDSHIDPALFREVERDSRFKIGSLTLDCVHISHDARDPVAYTASDGKKKLAVMTDLGTYTEDIVKKLSGVNGLLLESNHDIRMLEAGPYPYALKRRILGDFGHLSNVRSGELLNRIIHPDLEFVYLGHLSEENNYPETALMTVTQAIDEADNVYHASDFRIRVASRHHMSELEISE